MDGIYQSTAATTVNGGRFHSAGTTGQQQIQVASGSSSSMRVSRVVYKEEPPDESQGRFQSAAASI